jgi:hypothetical protein
MQYFPNNTLANFTTRLPQEITMGSDSWEVGLSEIHFPVNWNTLPSEDSSRIHIIDSPGSSVSWTIGAGRYKSIEAICKEVTKRFDGYLRLEWLDGPARVQAVVKTGVYKIRLSKLLSKLLRLPRNLEGLEKDDRYFFGDVVPRTNLTAETLYVYCDLARHQMVGDSSVPLLRIVSAPESTTDSCVVTYPTIQYVAAKGGTVQTIEVDIRDDTGKRIPFNTGRVVVVLHLRKKLYSAIN